MSKAHEIMPDIISHQGSANPIHEEHFTPTGRAIIKRQTIASLGEDGETLEPPYVAGRNEKW